MKKKKQIRAWAGYTDDKLDTGWIEREGFRDGLYGIFKTRAEARKRYQDVRQVLITEVEVVVKKKKS